MCVWEWRIDNRDLAPGHIDVDSAMLKRHSSECKLMCAGQRKRDEDAAMLVMAAKIEEYRVQRVHRSADNMALWVGAGHRDPPQVILWPDGCDTTGCREHAKNSDAVMQDAQLAQLSYFRDVYLLSRHLFYRMLQERQNRTSVGTLWDPICMVLSSFPHLSLNCKAPKLQPLLIEWHNNYPSTQLVNRIVSIPPDACSQLAILIFES